MPGNRQLSTGVQYATKALFDRTVYFPGAGQTYKNASDGSKILATTYQCRTGASGGSLKRATMGAVPQRAVEIILLNY
jgi:hypothetical protein